VCPPRLRSTMPMEGTYVQKSGAVAGTQSLPTPPTMSSNASSQAEIGIDSDYKDQVNGIVPGYSGHIPRARDKYAGASTGSIAPERGPHVAKGPQDGHVRPEDVLPPRFVEYIETQKGCVPGFAGFRPESVHVKNVSAYGGVPHQVGEQAKTNAVGLNFSMSSDEGEAQLAQGNRSFDWRRNPERAAPPSFRENVGGVLPGYTGHVPRATEKHGTSHYGGLAPDKPYVPLAQTGHEGYKIDPMSGMAGEKDVELRVIPNYQGFVPKARDAFGSSHYTKGR